MALAGEIMRYIGNEFVPMATKTASSSLSSIIPSAITKTGTSLATKVGTNLAKKAGTATLGNLVPKMATSSASPDMITLYRGLTQKYDPKYPVAKLDTSGYESWTDNPDLARQYGDHVYSIDVPKADIKDSYLDENPNSLTYGDRNPIYGIDKKAGLNGVSGKEYLLEVGSDYQKGLTYNEVPSEVEMAIKNSGVGSDVAKRANSYLGGRMLDKTGTTPLNNLVKSNGRKIAIKATKGLSEKVPVYTKNNPMSLQDAFEKTVRLRDANANNIINKLGNAGSDIVNVIDGFSNITPKNNPYASRLMNNYDKAISREIGEEKARELSKLLTDYTKFNDKAGFYKAKNAISKYLGSDASDEVVSKSVDMLKDAGVYRADNVPGGISWSTSPKIAKESRNYPNTRMLQGDIGQNSRVIAPQFTERFQPQASQLEVIGVPNSVSDISPYELRELLAGEGMRIREEQAKELAKYLRGKGNFGHKGVKGKKGGSAPRKLDNLE